MLEGPPGWRIRGCDVSGWVRAVRAPFGRQLGSPVVPTDALPQVGNVRLVNIRNPWGKFEWDGDWGDKSELWATHKHVAWACGWKKDAPDDGTFWMSWEDFVKYFDGLDVCFRTQGMRELQFEVAEECGACGPFVGGLYGIGRFFCLCQGLYKMWCVRKGTEEELEDFEKGTLKASDIKSHV